jgi:hypothetical protein
MSIEWKNTRRQIVNEMLEGVAFESDSVIEACLLRWENMSYDELKAEYDQWVERQR